MERDEFDPRLSRIATRWTLVFQAHGSPPERAAEAQEALMQRYAGAVHRYLLGALRDPDAAAELSQEFALRFLRGDFRHADPARGRFRDFVKRALRNLIVDEMRRRRRSASPLGGILEPAAPESEKIFERQFFESWRSEVLSRAWEALAKLQSRTGQSYHTVLRCRVDHPELRSPELAERLSAQLGRPVSAGGVRVALLRARNRFAGFLLEEVAAGLADASPESLEQELIDLNLLKYCRHALKRRGSKNRRPLQGGPEEPEAAG